MRSSTPPASVSAICRSRARTCAPDSKRSYLQQKAAR
jgi:hypothetical protein